MLLPVITNKTGYQWAIRNAISFISSQEISVLFSPRYWTYQVLKGELTNMTRAWGKEKTWVPDKSWTRPFNWVHAWQASCILLGSPWVLVAQGETARPGVKGSIPVGDSDFSLPHARVVFISSLFTFHYQAYTHHLYLPKIILCVVTSSQLRLNMVVNIIASKYGRLEHF